MAIRWLLRDVPSLALDYRRGQRESGIRVPVISKVHLRHSLPQIKTRDPGRSGSEVALIHLEVNAFPAENRKSAPPRTAEITGRGNRKPPASDRAGFIEVWFSPNGNTSGEHQRALVQRILDPQVCARWAGCVCGCVCTGCPLAVTSLWARGHQPRGVGKAWQVSNSIPLLWLGPAPEVVTQHRT